MTTPRSVRALTGMDSFPVGLREAAEKFLPPLRPSLARTEVDDVVAGFPAHHDVSA